MRNRIICIGNRFIGTDQSGPLVYDILKSKKLPSNTQLLDGGTCGLNLLGTLEHVERVIFVDRVKGRRAEGGVMVIENPADKLYPENEYGHEAGLAYLLRVAPLVNDGPMPSIALVGITQEKKRSLEKAAECCLQLLW